MKSIDKLREWSCHTDLHEIADEIESEIAERYMRLPLDADNVPIRVGDTCEMNGERFKVRQLCTNGNCWWAVDGTGEFYIDDLCRHVKSRTLEDVLRSYVCDFADSSGPCYDEEITRKYADKIRELLGGDAE